MLAEALLNEIASLSELSVEHFSNAEARKHALHVIDGFLTYLENGTIRTAIRKSAGDWVVESRVKKGILLSFRLGDLVEMGSGAFCFVDKHTLPTQQFDVSRRVRIVPGGTTIRRGAYVASTVTMMPPAYINVGAYVDEGTLIDSHALVGSCAQVGKRVHVSAAAQLGGVLEPIGAAPVIIEDDAFIGGNTGIYEGTRVCERAVIGAGVILTSSTKVYDIPNQRVLMATADKPLQIPAGAVVVPGARPIKGSFAESNGLQIATPVIIKYRDARTDSKAALEEALR